MANASSNLVVRPKDFVTSAMESHVGSGRFQYVFVTLLCLTYGLVVIHTYANMFASRGQAWHEACPIGPLNSTAPFFANCSSQTLYENENCSVPLSSWIVDNPGASIVGDFKLICGRHDDQPELGSVFFLGYAIGVVVCGYLSDTVGRRRAYATAYAFLFCGGFLAVAAPNLEVYAVARALLGAGVAGGQLTSYVWATEFLTKSTRGVMSWLPNLAFSFAQMAVSPLAYDITDWRPFLLACHFVSLLGFVYWWWVPESPQWLAASGRPADAYGVLCFMAKMNGNPAPPPMHKDPCFIADEASDSTSTASGGTSVVQEQGIFRQLMDPRIRFRFIVMSFNWFSISFTFYGLSLFSPDLPFSVYVANVLSALVGIPFYLVAPLLIEAKWCGRRGAIAGSYFLGGSCLMLSQCVRSQALSMAIYYVANGALSLAFAVLYVWAAELFPTDIRARSMSIQSVFARVGAILSPFVVDLGARSVFLALAAFAAPCLLSGLLDLLLPETRGQQLPSSISDLGPDPKVHPDYSALPEE